MKVYLYIILIALSSFAGFKTYQENVINIEGNAKLKVHPNMAHIAIGVSAENTDVDSAIFYCAQKFSKFMTLLKEYDFSESDIKSTRFSVNEDWEYEDSKRVKKGYIAKKMYKVTIRDLSKLKHFLFQATVLGINAFEDLKFTHNKLDSLKRAVVDLAIADANNMAKKISKKMNVKVGKPLVISNAEPEEFSYENVVRLGWVSPPRFTKGGLKVRKEPAELEDLKYLEDFFSINPGLIEIKNKVYITYGQKR